MLVELISYGVVVSSLILCILAKSDRTAQSCSGLVMLLSACFILQDHIQLLDRLFTRTATTVVGVLILGLAIIAVVRLKERMVGAVLLTLSTLLAGYDRSFIAFSY